MKNISVSVCFCLLLAQAVLAQGSGRAETANAVTAAQVNGIYRFSQDEFRILALGHHKLKVQYKGEWMSITGSPHSGAAIGEATINGKVATFIPDDSDKCKITITFLVNKIVVQQEGGAGCGFGANVNAAGTYRRVKAGRPKFPPIETYGNNPQPDRENPQSPRARGTRGGGKG
ncbi:MAG TPA: hypothetical protein VGI80_01260 [Pyrinomonadaceae bacterium]|jgi:hypothetical protein